MVSPNSRYMRMVRLHSLEELDSLPLTKWNIRQHGDDQHLEDAMQTGEVLAVLLFFFPSLPLYFFLFYFFFDVAFFLPDQWFIGYFLTDTS